MQKILVTGASGFIGQAFCESLHELNVSFLGTDLVPQSTSVLKMDVTDPLSLRVILEFKPDVIVHLAAQVDVGKSFIDPVSDLQSNILGTLNVLQAAEKSGTKNFIYISSGGAIYGENQIQPTSEQSNLDLKSPYGASKLAGEFYVKVLSERYGLAWTSLALSNCYGSVARCKKGVIFNFWEKLSRGERPTINGPQTSRDFIHVSDVTRAIHKAITKPTFCRVNISTAKETSLIELYAIISKQMAVQIEPIIGKLDTGEVAQSCLDNSLADSLLGWQPKIRIEDGIRLSL